MCVLLGVAEGVGARAGQNPLSHGEAARGGGQRHPCLPAGRGQQRLAPGAGPGWDPAATPAATLAEISAGTPAATLAATLAETPRRDPAVPGPPPWRCFGTFSLGCLLPDVLDAAVSAGRLRGPPASPRTASLPPFLPGPQQGSMGGVGTLAQPPITVLLVLRSRAGYPNRFARWGLWLKATFAPGVPSWEERKG